MDYVYDLKLFIDLIREENNSVALILLGHSMGGVIACRYALEYTEDINGLILSSAGVILKVQIPAFKKKISTFASKYAPSLAMPNGLNTSDLSHDPAVIDAYENDRLVHDKVTPRWFTEFNKAGEECINRSLELRMPLLVFSGKDDKIVDYRGSETLFNNASSVKKELHIFEGLYHETMNEEDNKKVLQIVARWILKTIAGKKFSKNKTKKPIKKVIIKKAAKKKVTRKSVAKAAYKFSKKVPLKKGAKKTIKKGVQKTVGTTKKTAKKTVKKAAKKTAKKAAKKKK
jgi:alpha-beta hydrolase superfamily lysophospholipase